MTNNDLNQIKGVFREEINEALNKRLSATEQMFDKKLTATEKGLTAIFDKKLTATEKRLKTEIAATEKRFNKRLTDSEKRLKSDITAAVTDSAGNIIEEIAGFMEVNILPKLERKADKSDIERIERRLDHVNDKIGEHDVRLKNIESIPVIAH